MARAPKPAREGAYAPQSSVAGASFDIVSRSFVAVASIGLIFFAVALVRFRRTVAVS